MYITRLVRDHRVFDTDRLCTPAERKSRHPPQELRVWLINALNSNPLRTPYQLVVRPESCYAYAFQEGMTMPARKFLMAVEQTLIKARACDRELNGADDDVFFLYIHRYGMKSVLSDDTE